MTNLKIAIIGAGPAGCFAAKLLAEKGYHVSVFEEHNSIGLPVQCTGLVTSSLFPIINLPSNIILNRIHDVKIFSSYKKNLHIKFKHPDYVIDRTKFDKFLALKAKRAGAKFFLGHRFLGKYQGEKNTVLEFMKSGKRVYHFFDYIIGADGPLSRVADSNNINKNRESWVGLQAVIKKGNDNCIEFYPFHGTYAWIVPVTPKQIIAGVVSERESKLLLDEFLEKRFGRKPRAIEYQAGVIPKFNFFARTKINESYLLGDAAGHVKATTGGGIIPGLEAAMSLSDSFKSFLPYSFLWRMRIGPELIMHNIIRKTLDNFSKKDYEILINEFKKEKLKKIIEKIDRDHALILSLRLLAQDPFLLRYTPKLIKALF